MDELLRSVSKAGKTELVIWLVGGVVYKNGIDTGDILRRHTFHRSC